jgi:hypothetical protein
LIPVAGKHQGNREKALLPDLSQDFEPGARPEIKLRHQEVRLDGFDATGGL